MPNLSWLDAVEARVAQATPGPWKVEESDSLEGWVRLHVRTQYGEWICEVRTGVADNALFIAHAPTDLARLCRLVRAQQRVIEAARTIVCSYKPQDLLNVPVGMHHCPRCGEMQIAGIPHLRDHAGLSQALTTLEREDG